MHLVHPESDVGAAGDQLSLRMPGPGLQQFPQRSRQQVGRLCPRFRRFHPPQRLQLRQQFGLIDTSLRVVGHLPGRLKNGSVTGAAAKVAGQFLPRQLARDAATLADMVLVHAEHAHDKARCAKAALRAMAVHHRLLRRVQRPVVCCQVFHRPQRHAVDGMGKAYATIDGAVPELAVNNFPKHHRTGAAIALVATLLGAGLAQVLAQDFQKGPGGWYIGQRDELAAADES